MQQPAPRGPAQRAADQLGGARAAVVGAARLPPPRRRAPRRRRSAWPGRRPPCRVAPPSPGRPARRRRRRRGRGCRRRRTGSCRPRAGRPDPPSQSAVSGTSASRSTPASSVPGDTGTSSRPAAARAVPSTRSQIAGVGRSTAATVAPHRSSGPSGPISAPAPSTATVRPSSRSHSGCAATSRTATAAEGSSTPAPSHAASCASRSAPTSRCPRYGSTSSVSGSLSPVTVSARAPRAPGRVRERVQRTVAVGVCHHEATAYGVQAGARDLLPRLGRRQARLDQPSEVQQVATAPRGLLLGRAGPERVDRPQRLGHHLAGDLARGSAAVGGGREGDAVAHGTIMASGRAG